MKFVVLPEVVRFSRESNDVGVPSVIIVLVGLVRSRYREFGPGDKKKFLEEHSQ